MGQLAPDVQALWEAYLSERPDLTESSGIDRRTVELARQAFAATAPTGMLSAAVPMTVPTSRRSGPLLGAAWAAALAAGLVLGVTLGLYLAPEPATIPAAGVAGIPRPAPATNGSGAVMPAAQAMPAAATTQEPEGGFWSTERLYRQAIRQQMRTGSSGRPSGRVTWTSPVKPPSVGDAL